MRNTRWLCETLSSALSSCNSHSGLQCRPSDYISTSQMQLWSQAAWHQSTCSWAWCCAVSVYQTYHTCKLSASPTWPLKSRGHSLLIFIFSEPITIPDTRWAFKRGSLNCWTESSAARGLGPSRPCGGDWQVPVAGSQSRGRDTVGGRRGKDTMTCFTKPCFWPFQRPGMRAELEFGK